MTAGDVGKDGCVIGFIVERVLQYTWSSCAMSRSKDEIIEMAGGFDSLEWPPVLVFMLKFAGLKFCFLRRTVSPLLQAPWPYAQILLMQTFGLNT